MKKQDLNDIKNKDIKTLEKQVLDLQKEKNSAALELAIGKAKNVHFTHLKRKDIARLKTLIYQRTHEGRPQNKVLGK